MSGNAAAVLTKPAFRKIEWLERDIAVERRPDGVIILKSRIPLQPYEKHIPASLAKWATEAPSRIWLAQRAGADRQWRKVSYGEAKHIVDGLTQGLLDLKLEPGSPVAILSGNSIEHALMTQAAMQARFPAAPVSPAYSLMSQDHLKLKYLFDLIKPKVVMVQDGPTFEKALKALDLNGVTVVHVARPCEGIESVSFADLAATPVTNDVETIDRSDHAGDGGKTAVHLRFDRHAEGRHQHPGDDVRQRRDDDAGAAARSERADRHHARLDAVESHHGRQRRVSSDAGRRRHALHRRRPADAGPVRRDLRNLHEVSPTYYANVPAGYAALAAAMEKDDALCRSFFRNLTVDGLWRRAAAGRSLRPDAGAGGAHHRRAHRVLYRLGLDRDRADLDRNLLGHRARRPDRAAVSRRRTEDGAVSATKYELRLRGINVTPGYFGQPDLTRKMFDEEGFYCIGDAGVFVDPADPVQGIIFAGRVVEDFKLTTGTFVHVGSLRTDAIAAATPVVQDALVAGQDRPFVGLLAWPNLHACRQIVGNPDATLRRRRQTSRGAGLPEARAGGA